MNGIKNVKIYFKTNSINPTLKYHCDKKPSSSGIFVSQRLRNDNSFKSIDDFFTNSFCSDDILATNSQTKGERSIISLMKRELYANRENYYPYHLQIQSINETTELAHTISEILVGQIGASALLKVVFNHLPYTINIRTKAETVKIKRIIEMYGGKAIIVGNDEYFDTIDQQKCKEKEESFEYRIFSVDSEINSSLEKHLKYHVLILNVGNGNLAKTSNDIFLAYPQFSPFSLRLMLRKTPFKLNVETKSTGQRITNIINRLGGCSILLDEYDAPVE